MNQIWIDVRAGTFQIRTSFPTIKDHHAERLLELLNVLIPLVETKAEQFLRKYLDPALPDNQYMVNLRGTPKNGCRHIHDPRMGIKLGQSVNVGS